MLNFLTNQKLLIIFLLNALSFWSITLFIFFQNLNKKKIKLVDETVLQYITILILWSISLLPLTSLFLLKLSILNKQVNFIVIVLTLLTVTATLFLINYWYFFLLHSQLKKYKLVSINSYRLLYIIVYTHCLFFLYPYWAGSLFF